MSSISKNNLVLLLSLCIIINCSAIKSDERWARKNEKFLRYIRETQGNQYMLRSEFENKTHIYLEAQYTGDEQYLLKRTSYIVQNLSIEIILLSDYDLSIKVRDSNRTRWELPDDGEFPGDFGRVPRVTEGRAYNIQWTVLPFTLRVTRSETSDVIFDTSESVFVYSNEYIQFESKLSSGRIYGIGERASLFDFSNGTYTIFNKDQWENFEDGTPGHNLYGYQPIYMNAEASDNFNIILFRTTNSMDIEFKNASSKSTIQYRVIGGIIDLRIFLSNGKDVEGLVTEYHKYLGGWEQVPFWGFGFHQCRYGYRNLSQVKDVLNNYTYYDLPLDTIWLDIDYMENYRVFTIDQTRYNLTEFKKIRWNMGLKFVPIIDPAIAIENHTALNEGVKRDVFLKSTEHPGKYLIGNLWPGYSHWVDYTHPNSTQYWKDMLQEFYNIIQFDGVWLDMNEMANVCDGECDDIYQDNLILINDEDDDIHNPDIPYYPGNSKLSYGALSPSAIHYNNISEYNLHSTGVLYEKRATTLFLKQNLKQKLTFIISRSSFYGSGKWGHHWSGDNAATWESLRFSITSIFQFNLFGEPFMGADICGAKRNTTAELCARWMQLGSLYPFSRNHNALEAIDQEPYVFGELNINTSRNSLKFRYSILKYYFTQFLMKNRTGTIFKPLFFEFPTHQPLYDSQILNDEFLIGSHLMVAPVLTEGADSVDVYFPPGEWYNVHTEQMYKGPGRWRVPNKLPDPLPVFLRDGGVLYTQDTSEVTRTWQLDNTVKLLAALKENGQKSSGIYAGAKNYSDSEEVYQKCIKDNCLVDIEVEQIKPGFLRVAYGPRKQDFDVRGCLNIASTKVFLRNHKQPENIQVFLRKNSGILGNLQVIQAFANEINNHQNKSSDMIVEEQYYVLNVEFNPVELENGDEIDIIFE